jgi:hypothetical protein
VSATPLARGERPAAPTQKAGSPPSRAIRPVSGHPYKRETLSRTNDPKGRESGLTSQANLERLVEKLDRSQSPFSRERLCACLDD